MGGAFLEVRNLERLYGTTRALDKVSFQVKSGEMFGLLGPNGAGKTTLLSILSCLLPPSGGEALLQGRRLSIHDLPIRRSIGIVPQELAIYGELTARENLVFFGELYDLRGQEVQHRVNRVLAAIGLQDRADSRVDTFSGGMKRRLNLGAALVHEPQLLLLDEPTTGVDPQSRNHIFEEIRRLNKEGVTVLYTSHYMEEVQALCNRVGIMDRGRLVACDTLPNLLRQLQGVIRVRVPQGTAALRERIAAFAPVRMLENADLELECHDVKATLLRVVSLLNELQLELTSLETEEPNLERVFLHLTGRALRD
jgi:ABC-2 type transport system ATP-binding protein